MKDKKDSLTPEERRKIRESVYPFSEATPINDLEDQIDAVLMETARILTEAHQKEIGELLNWLDDNNDLKWKSLNNSPEHCGLGISIEKWQKFRREVKSKYGVKK